MSDEKPNRDVLPSSLTRDTRVVHNVGGAWGGSRQLFCGNCGVAGGFVPADPELCDFAFWLCTPCSEKWGPMTGTYTTTDEQFFEKVKQAELEKYGRSLTELEQRLALEDPTSIHSKLAKERP